MTGARPITTVAAEDPLALAVAEQIWAYGPASPSEPSFPFNLLTLSNNGEQQDSMLLGSSPACFAPDSTDGGHVFLAHRGRLAAKGAQARASAASW